MLRLPRVLFILPLVHFAGASCGTGTARTAANVISGQSGVVLTGIRITNPDGPCIDIRDGSDDIRIEEVEIGPCAGDGIMVRASTRIVLRAVYIHDTTGNGVTIEESTGVLLTQSRVENTSSGLYALNSRGVDVSRNSFRNVLGPMPRGQFVQFDKVKGPGNRIFCNDGVNIPGESYPEDAINLYQSEGDSDNPIEVAGNRIQGGGPSLSGGGILLGDGGGAYQTARDNIVVDPGQYGLGVASGHHMALRGNIVYARQQPFTNVGIYVWNQYQTPCHAIAIENNQVNWTNRHGRKSHRWTPGNCGPVAGWNANAWNAQIDPQALENAVPVVCSEQRSR